jgi:nitric oxide synthase oxygenase domain/subunit
MRDEIFAPRSRNEIWNCQIKQYSRKEKQGRKNPALPFTTTLGGGLTKLDMQHNARSLAVQAI